MFFLMIYHGIHHMPLEYLLKYVSSKWLRFRVIVLTNVYWEIVKY